MHCKKCGVAFSESDIEIIFEENEEPICDLCAYLGELFLITYDGNEYVIQAYDTDEAIKRWKIFAERKQVLIKEDLSPADLSIKKLENVYFKSASDI